MIFSITFLFKAFFCLIFIILTLYLLYLEFKFTEHQNNNFTSNLSNGKLDKLTVLESIGGQKASKIIFTYLPALAAYYGVYQTMRDRRALEADSRALLETQRALEASKAELRAREDISAAEKIKQGGQGDRLSTGVSNLVKSDLEAQKYTNQLAEIHQIEMKELKGEKLTTPESDLLKDKDYIQNMQKYHNTERNKALGDIEQVTQEISKSNVFGLDFSDLLSKLTQDEILALCNLVFNQLILSSTISIILVIYGDFLIKRFNLNSKYPKIAKFIQLRHKLQQYYLNICMYFVRIIPTNRHEYLYTLT